MESTTSAVLQGLRPAIMGSMSASLYLHPLLLASKAVAFLMSSPGRRSPQVLSILMLAPHSTALPLLGSLLDMSIYSHALRVLQALRHRLSVVLVDV